MCVSAMKLNLRRLKPLITHRNKIISVIIMFGWVYYKEINQLIINVLTSPELVVKIINGLVTLFAGLYYFKKKK
jgi:hypothetical protein